MGGFDYPNDFIYQQELSLNGMNAVFGAFVVVYLLAIFFSVAISVACYVLQSLGLYTIAQRRGLRYPWLAWVPLGNIWILGSISDQYQYVVKGKFKIRRKIMVALTVGILVSGFLLGGAIVESIVTLDRLATITGVLGGVFLLVTVGVILTVLEYVACYDLFQSCQPSNSVLYLILSIFLPVTLPIFVFICRKKDLGMPPRRDSVQEIVEAEVAVEPVEEGFASPEEFEEE